MESLFAAVILFAGVLAVVSAIMCGQQRAMETERRVAAILIADDLLSQTITHEYSDLERDWQGYYEVTPDSLATVQITPSDESLPDLGVLIRGKLVSVKVMTPDGQRTFIDLHHFIPEPQS